MSGRGLGQLRKWVLNSPFYEVLIIFNHAISPIKEKKSEKQLRWCLEIKKRERDDTWITETGKRPLWNENFTPQPPPPYPFSLG